MLMLILFFYFLAWGDCNYIEVKAFFRLASTFELFFELISLLWYSEDIIRKLKHK